MPESCASFARSGKPCQAPAVYDVSVVQREMGTAIGILACKRHLPEWVDQAARGLERFEFDQDVRVRRLPPIPPDAWDRLAEDLTGRPDEIPGPTR